MNNAQEFADRYVAVWNEIDPAARREAIGRLWLPTGVHYVGAREARGLSALEQRVEESHRKNVQEKGNVFRAQGNARALRDVVTFNWEMVRRSDGEVLAVGLEFFCIDADGFIRADYQFIIA